MCCPLGQNIFSQDIDIGNYGTVDCIVNLAAVMCLFLFMSITAIPFALEASNLYKDAHEILLYCDLYSQLPYEFLKFYAHGNYTICITTSYVTKVYLCAINM